MTRFYSLLLAWCCIAVIGCGASNETPSSTVQPQASVAEALPLLSISTNSGADVTSKEIYEKGRYTLTSENGQLILDSTLEIRGRGNSTWLMPKKPYRLKLTDSTSLLSMPANKDWALLANYADKTLMRNEVAFELSRRMGMEYTTRSTYVELQLNGAYRGVYQLVEHIRVGADRVNIPELKIGDTGPSVISGGYLIEIDSRRGEDFCFDSERGSAMTFCLKNPDKLLEPGWEAQRDYIKGYIDQTEQAIFSNQFADPVAGYAAYLDVDSAISYYLINEVFKNVDGNLRLSTFLYKKRDGKLTFSPVWDFDIAIGNVNYGNADKTDGWHIRSAPWFTRMFADPVFAGKVKARWAQLKASGDLDSLFSYIDGRAQLLSKVQVKNFQTWDILGIYVWPNRVVTGSYDLEVVEMKDWLRKRIAWMDRQLSQ